MSENEKYVSPDLLKLIDQHGQGGRINAEDLSVGDCVEVVTKNSSYSLELIEFEKDRPVFRLSSNNKKYASSNRTFIIGTTIFPGSSIISPGYFGIIGSLEMFFVEDKAVVRTSGVQSVFVNGYQILPKGEVEN
jgi:hypothetical protein